MKIKTVLTAVLMLFVVGSLTYMVVSESGRQPTEPAPVPDDRATGGPEPVAQPETPSAQAESAVVRAYYFHGAQRCPTCQSIESNAAEAIAANFEEEMQSGRLTWQTRNIDEPENEHYIRDFKLAMSGVVIAEESGGTVTRWVNLADVWKLARNPDRLQAYVTTETRRFLDAERS